MLLRSPSFLPTLINTRNFCQVRRCLSMDRTIWRMPYHCLQQCGDILVAARGSSIDLFSLQDGSLLSTWDCPNSEGCDRPDRRDSVEQSEDIKLATSPPPAKRRRLSEDKGNVHAEEQENGKRRPNHRSKAVFSGLLAPAVIALGATKKGRHVIAVTGEDKSIRVFEVVSESNGSGKQELRQLSQRAMPKRPCVIAITEDDATIISGDKFGDVYSLPLLPLEDAANNLANGNPAVPTSKPTKELLSPAANTLTVHSQRNLRALENQKRQAKKPSEKLQPEFERSLLLGHVSMLTDIVLASIPPRKYIITSDRDEHIRVSRGIPQAHIIEGYCLGHSQFVSRLCVPAAFPNMLISGGGDCELFLWDWESGQLLSKVDMKCHVDEVMLEFEAEPESNDLTETQQLTVSAIVYSREAISKGSEDFIVVTCEGIPALFYFLFTGSQLRYKKTVKLPGNPLAVALVHLPNVAAPDLQTSVVVSSDTFHKPGSTTTRRDPSDLGGIDLKFYALSGHDVHFPHFKIYGDQANVRQNSNDQLSNLLYRFTNLRKRDGENQAD